MEIYSGSTQLSSSDITFISNGTQPNSYTATLSPPLQLVPGTYQFVLAIIPNPSEYYNYVGTAINAYNGEITVNSLDYLGNPVTFYLSIGSTFKSSTNSTGLQNCHMDSLSAQSVVSSSTSPFDWIVVEGTNPGASFT